LDSLVERKKEYASYRLARAKEEYETADQIKNAKVFFDQISSYVEKKLEE